jgi:hypothetical protein
MVIDHPLLLPVRLDPTAVILYMLDLTRPAVESYRSYRFLGCVFWNVDIYYRESIRYRSLDVFLGNISLTQSQWSLGTAMTMEQTYNYDIVCIKRAVQGVRLPNCFRWVMEYDQQWAMLHKIFSNNRVSVSSILLQSFDLRGKHLMLERLGNP